MNRKLVIIVGLLAVFLLVAGQALAQVTVWGEGAWTDTDVQINIYASIPEAEALRSFGVRLIYDPDELTFDQAKSSKNENEWYLGDGSNNEPYMDPSDVTLENGHHAVVTIGGILDTNDTTKKVFGDRVLLATIWFTRPAGSSGPLTTTPTLDLGKPDPFKNFVVDTTTVLDGSGVAFENPTAGKPVVEIYERGDANGNNHIESADMFTVRSMLGTGEYRCYADCNANGHIESADMFCIRGKL